MEANMTQEELLRHLEDEVQRGKEAQAAYDSFIKPFLDEKRFALFDNFQLADISQPEVLLECKRMCNLVDKLEEEVQEVIMTGKLAARTIAGTDEEKSNERQH